MFTAHIVDLRPLKTKLLPKLGQPRSVQATPPLGVTSALPRRKARRNWGNMAAADMRTLRNCFQKC